MVERQPPRAAPRLSSQPRAGSQSRVQQPQKPPASLPKARGNSIAASSRPNANAPAVVGQPPLSRQRGGSTSGRPTGLPKPAPFKPSDRLTQIKTADPFASAKTKQKTNFGYAYTSGTIPCRINHGCNQNQLAWDCPPDLIDSYDPLLINCFEGLQETDHPYAFVAFQALKELLEAKGSGQKTIPLLPKLTLPLRQALCTQNLKIWQNCTEAVRLLAISCGQGLTPQLHIFLAQLNNKIQKKEMKDQVMEACAAIDQNCGPEAKKLLKAKVPMYASFF